MPPSAAAIADGMLSGGARPSEILDLERQLIESEAPLDQQVGAKLARSKLSIQNRSGPLHVSVVFAMYRETKRMMSPADHPLGEDFINRKVSQLRWLFDGEDGWDLVMVDDGCPEGSGEMAEGIIATSGLGDVASVYYIEDAIRSGHTAVAGLTSTEESRKGGSIHYGMHEAATTERQGQVVVYTDADISTDLGQVGLLVSALDDGALCAAASRREPESVVVKSGGRNDRGKLFIYLWKQMLPELSQIIDSQCGFKGFPGRIVPELVSETIEKQFAFDIELMLRCELRRKDSTAQVPVAWIDSEAGSTTTDLEPYLPMLQSVARMYRQYSAANERAESFVHLVEHMDQETWAQLLEHIPSAITEREPLEFSSWAGVEADEMDVQPSLGSEGM